MNKYNGKILRVIDGDTYEALICIGFNVVQKFHVRLDGIDTPEKNTPEGVKAKEYVRNLIENKEVVFTDEGHEKYGRARAKVILEDGTDLTEFLIKNNIGKEYHGGKKEVVGEIFSAAAVDPFANSVIVGIATSYPVTMYMTKWMHTGDQVSFSGSYAFTQLRYKLQNFSYNNFVPMHFNFGNNDFLSAMFQVKEVGNFVYGNSFASLDATVVRSGDLPGGI